MGTLLATPAKELARAQWQPFQDAAQGPVTTTTATALHLELNGDATADLSPLSQLDPRAIRSLSLPSMPEGDENLNHLKHLTGLSTVITKFHITEKERATLAERLPAKCPIVDKADAAPTISLAELNSAPPARTLSFPADLSLGKVFIRPWRAEGPAPWQSHRDARGAVSIPEGMEAKLEVGYDVGANLGGLSDLDRNGLQAIGLIGEKVTDESMIYVGLLTGLRHVSLKRTNVTDEGFRELRELSLLLSLEVFSPEELTDEGLEYLQGQVYLLDCSLTGTHLSNRSVRTLQNFTQLRTLHLNDAGITEEGIISLEGALPNCKITS